MKLLAIALLAGVLGAVPASAQIKAGELVEFPQLQGLAQTPAKCAGDFAGRAVLYEFFAYW